MKIVVSDIETNGLDDCDKLWLCGGKDIATGEVYKFENCHEDEVAKQAAIDFYQSCSLIVGHNFISFDAPQLNRLLKPRLIDPRRIIDTLIVSRTVDYDIYVPQGAKSPHSLDAWGRRLKLHKGDFHDFSEFSEEMVTYWYQDLEVTHALYDHFKKIIYDKAWSKALRCEHDLQIELVRTKYYGFYFDKNKAEYLLGSIKQKMAKLEEQFEYDFPDKLEEVNRVQYRLKKDGTEMATVTNAKAKHALCQKSLDGTELVCYDYKKFNPGSPQDRIDVLWEAGWKPFEKTKTHMKFDRLNIGDKATPKGDKLTKETYNAKKEQLARYGWTVSEDNLNTLPDDAPAGAKALAQWLTLEGRRSSLVEWIGQVKADNRIHGSIMNIGAWTGRCAHKAPNTANIASPFHGDAKTPVQEVKKEYDLHLRACWTVPSGSWLVGADADGIQLRVLADYLWRHFGATQYAEAIMEGRKEDQTDIHNVNRAALGVEHATRDDAKTFIYSWLLGAGVAKTASILRISEREASAARERFERGIDGLYDLKNRLIPEVWRKKSFRGYDGRQVVVPSQHKALAGILQNGETVLMKHALIRWHEKARAMGLRFKMVGFIHDEYQVEVIGEEADAKAMGQLIADTLLETGEELGFKIPTPGTYDIGKNWADTH